MKLVQLNIWGGKLEHQILSFIDQEQPDIVCMQEVNDLKGPSGALFATLDEIQEKSGLQHKFMSPSYISRYQKRSNGFGNAILSRYPLTQTNTTFTVGQYNPDFDLTEDDYNVRNLQHAVADCNGRNLHIFNHHGFLVVDSKLGNDETLSQMKLILSEIQKVIGQPVLLAGDFNLSPESESIALFDNSLRNLPKEHGLKSTYTQFNHHELVCDYIFVNNLVKVTKFGASKELVSDHKALILEFEI